MESYVLDFCEIDRTFLQWVGGKGANLGELTKAGFQVPSGFCITTKAFQEFIATSSKMEGFYDQLYQISADELEKITILAQEIRDHLYSLVIPKEIEKAILSALKNKNQAKGLAIRSSATAEDLPHASFAGQQETFLNVKGTDELLHAVKRCWSSLFTNRAIVYRIKNGFDHRSVLLSVVVQEMVQPDVSGIMFTADPITGHRGTVSIDASFGLGEALVSGLVSADLYQVQNNKIIKKQVAKKEMAIISKSSGGINTIPLDEEHQRVQALSDELILRLSQLGKNIEQYYKAEQDIEWCLVDHEFYIVQGRPITSLYPVPKVKDQSLHVLFSFGHQQMMTDAMKPLGLSVWRTLMPFGKPSGMINAESNILLEAGGRLFIDPTELLHIRGPQQILPKFMNAIDERISSAVVEVIHRPEFRRKAKNSVIRKTIKNVFPVVSRALINVIFKNPSKFLPHVFQSAEQLIAESENEVDSAKTISEKIKKVQQNAGELFPKIFKHVLPYALAGIMTSKLIEFYSKKWLDDPEAIHILNKSLPGNVTSEMGLLIGDMADSVRPYPKLICFLQDISDGNSFLSKLDHIEGGREFHKQLKEFINRFGMRGPGEIDLTRLRWNESPNLLIPAILSHVQSVPAREHRKKFNQGMNEAEKKMEEMLERLKGNPFKKQLMARWIKVYRNTMGFRELPKFVIIRHLSIYKNEILSMASKWVDDKILNQTEDVFYFTLPELVQLSENNRALDVQNIISSRLNQYQRNLSIKPPRVITSKGEVIMGSRKLVEVPEGAWIGTPVSAGTVEGRARIVLSPEKAKLQSGDILIAPFTDPGWTPLFHSAKGLVMEVGGMMTHGAVVAREYGIPAVVGIDLATEKIRDGDYIRVDGSQGIVQVLKSNNQ